MSLKKTKSPQDLSVQITVT